MPYRLTSLIFAILLVLAVAPPAVADAACVGEGKSGTFQSPDGSATVYASCGQTQPRPTAGQGQTGLNQSSGTPNSPVVVPVEPPVPQPMVKTCDDLVQNCPTIPEPAIPAAPTTPGAPPTITGDLLREAAARLALPAPEVNIGPDPKNNQWGIVAVGYPIWLWTPGPGRLDTTVTAQGITITIAATRTNTTFTMGDGTTIECTTMTVYPGPQTPPAESPTCGHRYLNLPDTPGAGYTVRATSHWNLTWTALGQTGTFTMTRAATRHLNVAEIQTVIVAR